MTNQQPRRDPNGITIALFFILGAGALGTTLATLGGWWIAGTVACGFLAAFGVFGLVESLQKKSRDHRGIQRPTS